MRGHMTTSIERLMLLAAVVAGALARAATGAPAGVLSQPRSGGVLVHTVQEHAVPELDPPHIPVSPLSEGTRGGAGWWLGLRDAPPANLGGPLMHSNQDHNELPGMEPLAVP